MKSQGLPKSLGFILWRLEPEPFNLDIIHSKRQGLKENICNFICPLLCWSLIKRITQNKRQESTKDNNNQLKAHYTHHISNLVSQIIFIGGVR